LIDGAIHLQYGRDTARAQSPVSPGEATFSINNSSRDYSPNNASSPITGLVLPGRACFLKATHASTTYTLFQGFLDNYEVQPEEQAVSFTAVDALARLRGVNITTDLHTSIRAGEAIGVILDGVGWSGTARDLDVGGSIFPYWWENSTDAYDALMKVLQSEGPPSIAFVDASGNFVFRDRHHRLTDAASVTSQATFKDSGTDSAGSVVFGSPFGFDAGWRDIVNVAEFSVDERAPSSAREVIWQDESVINFAASEVVVIEAEATDPFTGAITPAADVDFTQVSGTVTATLSRTSGQVTAITLTAGAGAARIQDLQLRATPIPVVRTRKVSTSDATSITNYGTRNWPDDAPWANAHDAKAIANLIINLRKDRREIITVTLDGGDNDNVMTQQLNRDLSDLVTITETQTATNSPYYIERIEHDVTEAGREVITQVMCERAPTTLDSPATVFIIGTSSIGTGVLAR
jgi:hypothetical protein